MQILQNTFLIEYFLFAIILSVFFLFQWVTVLESRAASSWFHCTYLRNTWSFNWVGHFHWSRISNSAIHYTSVWSHLTYDCESATLLGDLLHFSYSSWFLIHLGRVSQSSGGLRYLNKGKFVLERKDRIQVRGTIMNWGELESSREGALVLGGALRHSSLILLQRGSLRHSSPILA